MKISSKPKQFIIPYSGNEQISFTLFFGSKRVPIMQNVNILQQYSYLTEIDYKKLDEIPKSTFRQNLKIGNNIHNGFELPIDIYFTNKTNDSFNISLIFFTFKEEDFDEIINYNEYSFGFEYDYSLVHKLKKLNLIDYLSYINKNINKISCKVIDNAI